MILRDKIIFWLLAIFGIFWFLNSISSILFPFITALILAYFLDPLTDKLQKLTKSRALATSIILGGLIAIISTIFVVIFPLLYNQFLSFIEIVPIYYETFINEIYPQIVAFFHNNGYEVSNNIRKISEESISKIFSFSDDIIGGLMESSMTIINILSLIFITPILVFYLLKDWNLLVKNINNYLPARYAPKIRGIFSQIDKTLRGYIRGQFNVCLILSIIYGAGLSLIHLDFGLFIGILTGLMSFVPYVGMVIGVLIAIIVALFQWGLNYTQLGMVAIVFILGQIVESNFLTPKLIGKKIGLHPVWVIFSVFAFAVLFGFWGIILAVPMAAIFGVIIKSITSDYKKQFVDKE